MIYGIVHAYTHILIPYLKERWRQKEKKEKGPFVVGSVGIDIQEEKRKKKKEKREEKEKERTTKENEGKWRE